MARAPVSMWLVNDHKGFLRKDADKPRGGISKSL